MLILAAAFAVVVRAVARYAGSGAAGVTLEDVDDIRLCLDFFDGLGCLVDGFLLAFAALLGLCNLLGACFVVNGGGSDCDSVRRVVDLACFAPWREAPSPSGRVLGNVTARYLLEPDRYLSVPHSALLKREMQCQPLTAQTPSASPHPPHPPPSSSPYIPDADTQYQRPDYPGHRS